MRTLRSALSYVGHIGLLFLSAACAQEAISPTSLDQIVVLLVSGNEQEGVVGAELPQPLLIRANDLSGNPVQGQVVNFVVTSGGGAVFAGAAITNQDGVAQDYWTLGTSIFSEQAVEVRAVDPATGAKRVFGAFHAIAKAGAPASYLDYVPGYEGFSTLASAALLPFRDTVGIQVFDSYGNPVAGVGIDFSVVQGGGSLAGRSVITNDSGVGVSPQWTFGPPGPQQLHVDVPGLTGSDVRPGTAYGTAGRSLTTPKADHVAAPGSAVDLKAFVSGAPGDAVNDIFACDIDDLQDGHAALWRSDTRSPCEFRTAAPPSGQVLRFRTSIYGIGTVNFTVTGS